MKPTEGLVAVYDEPNAPIELRMFPIRDPRPGEVLVKVRMVRMCTICRSDIHSYLGHRPNPTPGVLGREIRPLDLLKDSGNIGTYAKEFFPPDFTAWRIYVREMVITVHIAVWGTLLAVLAAVPAGLMCLANIAQAEVDDLKEGLEIVEEKARAELGMLRPDEILVRVAPRR